MDDSTPQPRKADVRMDLDDAGNAVSSNAAQRGDEPTLVGRLERQLGERDAALTDVQRVGRLVKEIQGVSVSTQVRRTMRALSDLSPFAPQARAGLDAIQKRMEAEAKEKFEQVSREKQVLREMRLMRRELKAERLARRALEAKVEDLARQRTGAPGRPNARHFVMKEFARRAAAGKVLPKLKEEARHLASWFREAHPAFAPIQPPSVENAIREQYRSWRLRKAAEQRGRTTK